MSRTELKLEFCLSGLGDWVAEVNETFGELVRAECGVYPLLPDEDANDPYRGSYWCISTGNIETWLFDDIFVIFKAKFDEILHRIPSVMSQHKLVSHFTVVAWIDFEDETPAFTFTHEFLHLVHTLDAELELDLYYRFPSGTFPPKEKILYY